MRLLFSWPFRIAAHYLHLLRLDRRLVIELEVDVFDQERPNLVAEAVGIEMTLETHHGLVMCPSQPCLELSLL